MQYIQNTMKINGDVLSPAKVADSMARAKATNNGSASLHKPTGRGRDVSYLTHLPRPLN